MAKIFEPMNSPFLLKEEHDELADEDDEEARRILFLGTTRRAPLLGSRRFSFLSGLASRSNASRMRRGASPRRKFKANAITPLLITFRTANAAV